MSREIVIECMDCGTKFTLTAEEQAWYNEKGFSLPKRCHHCRKARRTEKNNVNKYGGRK